MATISFYVAPGDVAVQNLNGSGLGFFGSTFGQSVEVGAYQDSTYITDGNGLTQGAVCINNKYINTSGAINSLDSNQYTITYIPNRMATLNVRFTHDSAVKLQNTKLRIYDRSNINNAASGVTTKTAQIVHPNPLQTTVGSGDATWSTPAGSSVIMDLEGSPGMSGVHGLSTTHTSTQHDYYCLLSASPDSIGAKNLFGLYVQTEYL